MAWRVFSATMLARAVPEMPCDVLLEIEEWQALYCAIHHCPTPPDQPPSLGEAVRWIAQLGGFVGRRRRDQPGTETLWRGFQHLTDLAYVPQGGEDLIHPTGSRYRQGGVYVVIGGAGGIGEVWSEYMMRTYAARLVWIGRRQKDQAIQAKLDRLAKLGHVPLYLSADASDREALQQAYQAIKQEHGQIHGVVHAAIVLLDKSLANMEEERFPCRARRQGGRLRAPGAGLCQRAPRFRPVLFVHDRLLQGGRPEQLCCGLHLQGRLCPTAGSDLDEA